MTVGTLLRIRREALGRSARSVSLAAGLSESALGKIESGATEPSLGAFAQVAIELGLNDREIGLAARLAALRRSGTG